LKFLLATLFLSIFFIQLPASQVYQRILITKTLSKNSLKEIKAKLDKLHIKMYVKNSNNNNNHFYYVYSKEYTNNKAVKYDLRKVRTKFKSAYIITKENNKYSTKSEKLKSKKIVNELSPYFINLNFGLSSINGNGGASFGMEGGYIFFDDLYLSLGYLNSPSKDISLNNIYLSTTYQFKTSKNTNLYSGLLVGYSILELKNFKYTKPSTSSLLGANLGFKYNFNKNISIFTNYQGVMMDHIVKVNNDSSKVKFNFFHNLQFGVLYRF